MHRHYAMPAAVLCLIVAGCAVQTNARAALDGRAAAAVAVAASGLPGDGATGPEPHVIIDESPRMEADPGVRDMRQPDQVSMPPQPQSPDVPVKYAVRCSVCKRTGTWHLKAGDSPLLGVMCPACGARMYPYAK